MKTRIIIDIETKLNKIYVVDEITNKTDYEDEVTEQVEEQFHDIMEEEILRFVKENLEHETLNQELDYNIEAFDRLADYGEFNIKVTSETEENTTLPISSEFACLTCWVYGQVRKDCPYCKGTGLAQTNNQTAYDRFIEREFPNYAE